MSLGGLCRCTHTLDAHEHYRGGHNCPFCPCPRARRRLLDRTRDVLGLLGLFVALVRDVGRRPRP